MERKKTAFLHAHAVQLLLWTWYPADYNEGGADSALLLRPPSGRICGRKRQDPGACWVHIRNRRGKRKSSDEEVRELLGIPEGYAVLNLIALGGKGEYKRAYTEKDFDFRKIHREVY